MKNNENPKKYVFNIFASFLAFSTLSKKEFKFSNVFWTRSTFHALFLKALIFLIKSMLILLVFKKYKKKQEKSKFTKKRKLRDQFWGPSNILPIYSSLPHTHKRGGEGKSWKKKKKTKPKPKSTQPFFLVSLSCRLPSGAVSLPHYLLPHLAPLIFPHLIPLGFDFSAPKPPLTICFRPPFSAICFLLSLRPNIAVPLTRPLLSAGLRRQQQHHP